LPTSCGVTDSYLQQEQERSAGARTRQQWQQSAGARTRQQQQQSAGARMQQQRQQSAGARTRQQRQQRTGARMQQLVRPAAAAGSLAALAPHSQPWRAGPPSLHTGAHATSRSSAPRTWQPRPWTGARPAAPPRTPRSPRCSCAQPPRGRSGNKGGVEGRACVVGCAWGALHACRVR